MSNKITEYLTNLLNKKIAINSDVILSSAQRARFHAWLIAEKIPFNEGVLSQQFKVECLLSDDAARIAYFAAEDTVTKNNLSSELVGIDIQRIDELFPDGIPSDPKSASELTSIFTLSELSYAQSKHKPIETLAGIFAAKEAIKKCKSMNLDLIDITISHSSDGSPNSLGYAISISHSGNYAVAVAIPLLCNDNLPVLSSENIPQLTQNVGSNYKFRRLDLFFLGIIGALFILVIFR
jgi:phosphopantetheinyl transferase (holo-ACP synthase)